jgi:HSP20 family protein
VDPTRKENIPGLGRLQGEVDKMFRELMRSERVPRHGRAAFYPNADVYFEGAAKAFIIKLELAGIDPAAISLDVEENVLRISGARKDERPPDSVYQQMEIAYGRFERLVLLPPEVDTSKATANYCGGFLSIVLPVRTRTSTKRIPITVRDDPAGSETIAADGNLNLESGTGPAHGDER